MDEKPDQIMNQIESQRNRLGQNLQELETRVRTATDWRTQFDRHPYWFLGAALGGGLLLGSMSGGSSRSYRSSGRKSYASSGSSAYPAMAAYDSSSSSGTHSNSAVSQQRGRAADTFDKIGAALIGVATAKVQDFLNELVPEFSQHFQQVGGQPGSQAGGYQPDSHSMSSHTPAAHESAGSRGFTSSSSHGSSSTGGFGATGGTQGSHNASTTGGQGTTSGSYSPSGVGGGLMGGAGSQGSTHSTTPSGGSSSLNTPSSTGSVQS